MILNVSLVLSYNYKIVVNDGTVNYTTGTKTEPIKWKIVFRSYGAEKGFNLPTASITGEDVFSIDIDGDEFEYTGDTRYHASWGPALDSYGYWICRELWCTPGTSSNYVDQYFLMEHYESSSNWVSETRTVAPGDYNLNLISYGDGFHPTKIEPASDWTTWEGAECNDDPIYVDTYYYENQ